MTVNNKQLDKIIAASNIEVADKEKPALAEELSEMVGRLDKLKEANVPSVNGVFILSSAPRSIFREDEVIPSPPREENLASAPVKMAGCFVVPKENI